MNLIALAENQPFRLSFIVSFEKSQTIKAVGKVREQLRRVVQLARPFSDSKTMKKHHEKRLSNMRNTISACQCAKRAHAETARCDCERAEYPVGGSAHSRHFRTVKK